jgi:hypothetical protein
MTRSRRLRQSSTGYICQSRGCWRDAWYQCHGAWSVFDWRDVYVCSEHLSDGMDALEGTTVDGQLPQEVWSLTLPLLEE